MANPGMWVHGTPNILNNCRTAHIEVEEAPADWGEEEFEAEAYMKTVEAKDPYEPLLNRLPLTRQSGYQRRSSNQHGRAA